ncbi:hypothetical protein HZA38_04645 [Candidatus Peregrinibacteria bacterium]|nr:hypothetical protein [Candidatus Peregrinibacteria bacterium]
MKTTTFLAIQGGVFAVLFLVSTFLILTKQKDINLDKNDIHCVSWVQTDLQFLSQKHDIPKKGSSFFTLEKAKCSNVQTPPEQGGIAQAEGTGNCQFLERPFDSSIKECGQFYYHTILSGAFQKFCFRLNNETVLSEVSFSRGEGISLPKEKCEWLSEKESSAQIENSQLVVENTEKTILRKRNAIELAYPEFKNFEQQESFAGTSVKVAENGGDSYFAYITNGSGVPIAKAVCFKVDTALQVSKIGEFPNSSLGSLNLDIDPKTCNGIQ